MAALNAYELQALMETGSLLTGGVQAINDLSQNPKSLDALEAYSGAYGVLTGALQGGKSAFALALGTGVGVPFSALGVAVNAAKLYSAWEKFQIDIYSDDPAIRTEAIQDMGDRLAGTIAAIGGTMAAIPVPAVQQIGLGIWLGGTAAQQVLNGNAERAIDIVGTEIAEAIATLTGGPMATIHQYNVGGGEVMTVTLTDRYGISTGEYGRVSGISRSIIEVPDGRWIDEYLGGSDLPFNSYFENVGKHVSSQTFGISEESLIAGLQFGASVSASYAGNTVDYVAGILGSAGIDYGSIAGLLPGDSLCSRYAAQMSWFDQPIEAYQNLFDTGIDADSEAYARMYVLEQLEKSLGESIEHEETQDKVRNGVASPIVIDLNGDGIQTVGIHESGVQFDLHADAGPERTAWLSPGDGFLVMDLNMNGQIDGHREMFGGPDRGDGYAELARLDDVLDGVIDQKDISYRALSIWRDANQNGLTDRGELATLREADVDALQLAYRSQDVFDKGNLIGEVSSAQVGGVAREMADVYFRFSPLTGVESTTVI